MTSSKNKIPRVFASLVVKVKSITLTETSVQCVINSEEGQAGIADTLMIFFYFFVISGVCNEQ